MKILLLEDDIALNKAIRKITEFDQHITTSYFDGQEVFNDLNIYYDLYILDINVPNRNGLELLNIIYRKNVHSKVIIISSNTDIDSIKQAYEFGCVDYLKKPFHLDELRIKIDKLNQIVDPLSNVELKNNCVLTKKEKNLLILLLKNKGKTVTYEMIESAVYKNDNMSINSLRALVKRIRIKLANNILQNVLEEGYKLVDK